LNQYEIAVLYHPDLEVDLTKAEEKVKKIITSNGGKMVSTDNWGRRKLAYTIKKQDHAVYVFYTVDLPGTAITKIDSTLNITDEVIRHLITKPDQKAIEKAAQLKADKEKKAAQRKELGEDNEDDNDEDK
jgi:small subunit ribosomal protein S6